MKKKNSFSYDMIKIINFKDIDKNRIEIRKNVTIFITKFFAILL